MTCYPLKTAGTLCNHKCDENQEIVLQSVSETRNTNTNRWNMESSGQTREGMQRWEKLNEWDWICISFPTARGSDSLSLFVCLSSGPAVRFSSFSPSGPTPPPLIGQHTVEVLRDVLSYSNEVIETLLESKAVVQNEVFWLAERKIINKRKEKTKTDHFYLITSFDFKGLIIKHLDFSWR